MSGRKRFFVQKLNFPQTREAVIEGDEFAHAVVQRVEEGDELILLDGSGKEYTAIVTSVSKRNILVNIMGESISDKEPTAEIYLLCGALKGDKTELVVQKATELGAARIGIFNSEFCSAYMNTNKLERLNKVAREAAKQCMRSRAPEVVYYDNFLSALKSAEGYKNKLFACEFAGSSDIELSAISGSTALVVGSEGGFKEEEFGLSKQLGFSAVSLGKRILRAETAAISLMTIAAFSLGELR